MAENSLAISITIDAPIATVWNSIADWQSQGDWMLQTQVWVTSSATEGVGTTIAAFTGPFHKIYPRLSFLGLLDIMRVTQWEPPHRCDVEHIGKILKGTGTFKLSAITPTQTRFDWSETVVSPRVLFAVVAPFLYVGVFISLKRFARTFA